MMSGYDLQDQAMQKEQAKIMSMRNANEDRRRRFLDAPGRTIGIDCQALDAQVAAARRKRDDEKEANRIEKLRSIEISNILESSIQEERQMKQEQMEEMKKSWSKSSIEKANMRPDSLAIDPAQCGISSAQNFSGEDSRKNELDFHKKQEMKRWVTEKLYHEDYKKMNEKVEELNYVAMLHSIDAIRGAAEMSEADMRRFMNHTIKDENTALAAEHRYRYRKELTAVDQPTSLNLFDEDVYNAMDDNGHIVRKDMFKGFTPAQKKRILHENEILLIQKREREEKERMQEVLYSRQQALIQRTLEDASHQERAMRENEKAHHMSVLKQQAYDTAMERIRDKRYQQEPPQERGFYEGFGKSCR